MKNNQQRISGIERDLPELKELQIGTPLFLAAVEHDGGTNETKVVVTRFSLKEYEIPENKTEVDVDERRYVTLIDDRFPNVPIKHQLVAEYHLDEKSAVSSLFEGVHHVVGVLGKYVLDNYGLEHLEALKRGVDED